MRKLIKAWLATDFLFMYGDGGYNSHIQLSLCSRTVTAFSVINFSSIAGLSVLYTCSHCAKSCK